MRESIDEIARQAEERVARDQRSAEYKDHLAALRAVQFDDGPAPTVAHKRRTVAREKGLPVGLAQWVRGTEPLEIRSHVDQLLRASQNLESATTEERPAVLAQIRRDVAEHLGLPESAARRLQGSTVSEIHADAEELMRSLDPAEPPAPRARTFDDKLRTIVDNIPR